MNGRHLLYSLAARVYPGRRSARRRARRGASQAGAGALEYDELLARVRADLAIDARLGHVEDLIAHLELRIDRVLREVARRDPATRWEPPPGSGEDRSS